VTAVSVLVVIKASDTHADGWRVVDDDDYNQSVGNPKRKV
jgi:hypothetical protein